MLPSWTKSSSSQAAYGGFTSSQQTPPPIPAAAGALFGSIAFAIVASPVVLSSSLLLCVSRQSTAQFHTLMLQRLWAFKWRLIHTMQPPSTRQPQTSQHAMYSNAAYGALYFGIWNLLLDAVLSVVPLVLLGSSVGLAVDLAAPADTVTTSKFVANSVFSVMSLAASLALIPRVVCHGLLPCALAFALPSHSATLPATPRTPRGDDMCGFHVITNTPYHLDTKATLANLSIAGSAGHSCARAVDTLAKRIQAWSMSNPKDDDLPAILPPHVLLSPEQGSFTTVGSSTSPSECGSSDSPIEPPHVVIVDVDACATRIQRTFQRRRQQQRRRQPLLRPLTAAFPQPSAPSPDRISASAPPLKQLAPLVQRQQVAQRRPSLSSSDEEDFQSLCDSVLKRTAPIAPPVYHPLSPVRQPPSPRAPSPTDHASRRPVSRGLGELNRAPDEAPRFTAFAPHRVSPSTSFYLVVGCHTDANVAELKEFVETETARPAARSLAMDRPVSRGTRITVSIDVPHGFQVLSPSLHETLTWRADVDAVHFHLFAEGSVRPNPHSITVKIVADEFVGVLNCCVVVGPKGVPKHQQCEDEWYRLDPVSDALEVLAPGFDEIAYDQLHLTKWIGRGHFGEAYLATYKGKPVVVKTLRQHDIPALQHEAAVLSMFGHHPCIVPFVGACTNPDAPLAVVTEYMPLGSLASVVSSPASASEFPAPIRTNMLRDAANGLAHLHASAFLHRDMAARNCLVNAAHQVKVGDFGLARRGLVVEGSPVVGPLKYMAPESLQPPYVFSQASDVFAFGVTMWETYHGTTPYADLDPVQVAVRVCEGDRLPLKSTHIPPASIDLIAQCFDANPDKRPTMVDVYNRLKCK